VVEFVTGCKFSFFRQHSFSRQNLVANSARNNFFGRQKFGGEWLWLRDLNVSRLSLLLDW